MVNVVEIGEMGAYVTLLEYDNIQVNVHILFSFNFTYFLLRV